MKPETEMYHPDLFKIFNIGDIDYVKKKKSKRKI